MTSTVDQRPDTNPRDTLTESTHMLHALAGIMVGLSDDGAEVLFDERGRDGLFYILTRITEDLDDVAKRAAWNLGSSYGDDIPDVPTWARCPSHAVKDGAAAEDTPSTLDDLRKKLDAKHDEIHRLFENARVFGHAMDCGQLLTLTAEFETTAEQFELAAQETARRPG